MNYLWNHLIGVPRDLIPRAPVLWLSDRHYLASGAEAQTDGSNVETWVDGSGRGNHATNTIGGRQPEYLDGELDFDTLNYLQFPDASSLDFERTDGITFAGKFERDNDDAVLLVKYDRNNAFRGWSIGMTATPLGVMHLRLIHDSPSSEIWVEPTTAVAAGVPTYFVFTYAGDSDATNVRMWLNGVEETTSVVRNTLDDTVRNSVTAVLTLDPVNFTSSGFNGRIKELLAYKRELSVAEVTQINNYLAAL